MKLFPTPRNGWSGSSIFFLENPEMLARKIPFEAWTQLAAQLRMVVNDVAARKFWEHFEIVEFSTGIEITTRSDSAALLVAVAEQIKDFRK